MFIRWRPVRHVGVGSLKEVLVPPNRFRPTRIPRRLWSRNIANSPRVHSMGEKLRERQSKKNETQVINVADAFEKANKIAFRVRRDSARPSPQGCGPVVVWTTIPRSVTQNNSSTAVRKNESVGRARHFSPLDHSPLEKNSAPPWPSRIRVYSPKRKESPGCCL